MIMITKINAFLLFFCLFQITIHAMDLPLVPTNQSNKPHKTYNHAYKNRRHKTHAREKALELKKEREKKLNRILMID